MIEIVELLESEVSYFEIFTAIFQLELAGKVELLRGTNFVGGF